MESMFVHKTRNCRSKSRDSLCQKSHPIIECQRLFAKKNKSSGFRSITPRQCARARFSLDQKVMNLIVSWQRADFRENARLRANNIWTENQTQIAILRFWIFFSALKVSGQTLSKKMSRLDISTHTVSIFSDSLICVRKKVDAKYRPFFL